MSTPTPNGNTRSWDAPACPRCVTPVFVRRRKSAAKLNYKCEFCKEVFTR